MDKVYKLRQTLHRHLENKSKVHGRGNLMWKWIIFYIDECEWQNHLQLLTEIKNNRKYNTSRIHVNIFILQQLF
jgi:hypothetical protein